MRFIIERNNIFSRAKAVAVSANFIACATGGKVKIYNHGMNLIHVIDNLKYVYNCEFSPDEKRLLLLSITNCYYVFSLSTFELTRHLVKGEYTGNLEGRGCWTLDGQGCLLCVMRKRSSQSALRIYPDVTSGEFRDFLCDQYWLSSVTHIPKYNAYLISGSKQKHGGSFLIWYDGKTFYETLIKDGDKIGGIADVQFNVQNGLFIVRGTLGTTVCNIKGESVCSHSLLQQPCAEFSFSDVFQSVPLDDERRKVITTLSECFGFEHIQVPDHITALCYSKTAPYIYIGTFQKLYCVDAQNHTVEASIDVPFGVINIQEWDTDSLIVTSLDSVEFIKIQHDG